MLVRTESHIPLLSAREACMNYEGPVVLATIWSMYLKAQELSHFQPTTLPRRKTRTRQAALREETSEISVRMSS